MLHDPGLGEAISKALEEARAKNSTFPVEFEYGKKKYLICREEPKNPRARYQARVGGFTVWKKPAEAKEPAKA